MQQRLQKKMENYQPEVKEGDIAAVVSAWTKIPVQRLEEKEALPTLYREIGEAYDRLDDWSMYLITGYEDAERYLGRKAAKNRKIYNGMLKTYFYQFPGPKPPRRPRQDV